MLVQFQNLQNLLMSSILFPKFEVPLINLATLPSKPSKIAATIKNKTAKVKFPSIANLIELIPRQTPTRVRTLGRIYLVLFTETILNFFIHLLSCY